MAEKKCFNFIMLFFDCRQHLELLTDEQRGKLLLALFDYAEYGIAPELDPASQMAFSFLSAQIDRDRKAYDKKCQQGKENISKRWNTNNTDVYDCISDDTNDTKTKKKTNTKNKTKTNTIQGGNISPCSPSLANQVMELYNQICVSYPRCTKLSDSRKRAVNARLNSGVTLGDFKKAFEKAQSSDFLRGKNARDWTANFDWMIKDANIAKILDGNYDNKPEDTGTFGGTPPSYDLEELAKRGMYVPEI